MRVLGLLFLLAVLIGLFFLFWDDGSGADLSQTGTAWVRGETDPEGTEAEEVRLMRRNPFIEDYGREGGSTEADLASLRDVVRDCQLLLKDFDRYHLPGNPEIIKFLQGENPDRLAWIPADHPSLSAEGELLDRYGTSVFFHRLSGMQFEFRSAGQDRKMWTEDDVVVK